jgi:hypothetical protein
MKEEVQQGRWPRVPVLERRILEPSYLTQFIVIHDRRPRQLPTDHAHARTREYQNDHRRRSLSADGSAAPTTKVKDRRTAARKKQINALTRAA